METVKYVCEVWKDIPGYEGLYQVSKNGLIKNVRTGLILTTSSFDQKGYAQNRIYKNGVVKTFKVHKLVVLAFPDICGVWYCGCQIDHINGCKTDNRAENLLVTDALGNTSNPITKQRHYEATRHINVGIANGMFGKPAYNRKQVTQYTLDGEVVAVYESVTDAAKKCGFREPGISRCCLGIRKTYKGFVWNYSD